MMSGCGVSGAVFVAGQISAVNGEPLYLFGLEPMYHGLAAVVGIYAVTIAMRNRRNYEGCG